MRIVSFRFLVVSKTNANSSPKPNKAVAVKATTFEDSLVELSRIRYSQASFGPYFKNSDREKWTGQIVKKFISSVCRQMRRGVSSFEC